MFLRSSAQVIAKNNGLIKSVASVCDVMTDRETKTRKFFDNNTKEWIEEKKISLEVINNFFHNNPDKVKDDVYKDTINPAKKKECNTSFCKAVIDTITSKGKSPSVLILDTPMLNTARCLTQSSLTFVDPKARHFTVYPIRPENIYIPNPYFNIEKNKEKYNLYNTSLLQLLEKLPSTTKFNCMWLDYCCTWSGNKFCSPEYDIKLLFSQKRFLNITKNSFFRKNVFSITLSSRNATTSKKFPNNRIAAKTNIETIAKLNGYQIHLVNEIVYGQMFYLEFSIF